MLRKLDGKNIYVAGGTYLIADQEAGLKIEYSGYSKQVENKRLCVDMILKVPGRI